MIKRLANALVLFISFFIYAHAQQVTISNNLLYDAWLTPNLRVGARLAPHWSVGMTAGFRPWPTDDETTRKWRHLLLAPEVRYWKDSVDVHHFFGATVIYSHYNVGGVKFPFGMYPSVRDERRQGDLGALGLFYGYSWPLGRFWNVEGLLGGAVGYTAFDRYPCVHCGKKIGSAKKVFFMPLVALNIVYNIPGRPRRTVAEEPVVQPPVFVPEPPAEDSPLYRRPNVFLSPHIAGSLNDEWRRMADHMIGEFKRYLAGEAFLHDVNESLLITSQA